MEKNRPNMKTIIIAGKSKMAKNIEAQLSEQISAKVFRVNPQDLYQYKADLVVSTVSEKEEEIFLYDSQIPFISQNDLREGLKAENGIFNFTLETIIFGLLYRLAQKEMKEISEANLFFVGRENLYLNWFVQIKNKTKTMLSKTSFSQWFPSPFNEIDIIFYRPEFTFNFISVTRHYGKLPSLSNIQKMKAFVLRKTKPYQKACVRVDFWGKNQEGSFIQKSYAAIFDEVNVILNALVAFQNFADQPKKIEELFLSSDIVKYFKKDISIFNLS